ncbi:MAG TPA: DUF1127 domain-containing protein [Azospirillum sp.]|nr:DUF1127 domain-containing protein [Azospirillum sp.]
MEIAFRRRSGHGAKLSIAHLVATIVAMGRRWWRWRRERNELLVMDDRMLKDIGLTRLDAKAIARKPFWRS